MNMENFNDEEILQLIRAMLFFDMKSKDERYAEFNDNIIQKLRKARYA